MLVNEFFPCWDQLTETQQKKIRDTAARRQVPRGQLLHSGQQDCEGLILVESGLLRAFILSDGGREITIYRLKKGDICLFSASCALSGIRFEVSVEAEQDSSLLVIPSGVYKQILQESAVLSNFTNSLMGERFSWVMWLIEQVLWKGLDGRLASFLLEESALRGSETLDITHEKIASHLGTAREVVTRMLRYFGQEKLVRLSRGRITLTDPAMLREIAR